MKSFKEHGDAMKKSLAHPACRYLFRDDVLRASGDGSTVFERQRLLDDRMLTFQEDPWDSISWYSYRYVMYDQGAAWQPMPPEETARLRALLLIQQ